MHITLHHDADGQQLDRLIRAQCNAKQRDRLRAVRLALEGTPTRAIQEMLGRSKDFVQRWCYAYRDHGLAAIQAKPQPGRPPKLPRAHEPALTQRLDAGPTVADGVCTLRGAQVTRILEQEFGVCYSLQGAYDLLHRLGYSCLKPRPRHRKNDPHAMRRWLAGAPFLSSRSSTPTPTSRSRSGFRTRPASASRAHSPSSGPAAAAGPPRSSRPSTNGSTSSPPSTRAAANPAP